MSGLPFICPNCRASCPTLRDLLLCCPRVLRAYTDQLIERNHEDDRYLHRVLCGRASNALAREVAARLAARKEAA